MSRDQNAGRSHNIKIYISSFERLEQFKYFVTALWNQNSLQEEIKSWLKSGNACYHSVQNLFSCSLLSKNIRNKLYVGGLKSSRPRT
jgi:L-arabinose isomerase